MGLKKIWREYPAGRAPALALAVAGMFLFVQTAFIVPYFERVAGFKPFDAQFPLSPVAMAIQLGAYGAGAADAYVIFVANEIPLALSVAVLFVFLWRWMFSISPNRIFLLLHSGGMLLTPFIAVVFDIAESVEFARLIGGLSGPDYASAIEFGTLMHRLRVASEDMRIYVTVFFAGVIVTQWLRQHGVRR